MKLKDLYSIIQQRKKDLPKNSYTADLFRLGKDRIIQKFGEESVEVLIAAKNGDKKSIIAEVADLQYHLLVLLVNLNINLKDIEKELQERYKKRNKT